MLRASLSSGQVRRKERKIISLSVSSKDILGADGPLAARLEGFTPRRAQQEMADRIEQALADYSVFIAESGTGTGKTFAYLVPALLSGRKILISTGTRHLQDQLYHRDLPLVRDALAVPVSTALLKGRSNYLCRYRLESLETDGRLAGRREQSNLARIREWGGHTRRGDIAEMNAIPEDSDLWPLVTSTADNCLGSACAHYDECFVNRARREALAADVVVVNHHLFFADLALREEGFGQLLPGVEAVIFDEAHQLPEVASNFLGISLSSHQLVSLCRDSIAEDLKEHSGVAGLPAAAQALEKAVADFRLTFGVEPRRDAWDKLENAKAVHAALAEVKTRLMNLSAALDQAAGKGQGLANGARRASDLLDRLLMISESTPADYVAWFETTARSFMLYLTPLDIAASFRQHTGNGKKAWIFTSATLAVKKSFAHFQARLGLEAGRNRVVGQSFRLCATDSFIYSARTARPVGAGLHGPRDRRRVAGAAGQPRTRVHSVHQSPRPQGRAPRACAMRWIIRCWCRATPRARNCCGVFATWATPCCSAPAVSGKAWTCAARRCPA